LIFYIKNYREGLLFYWNYLSLKDKIKPMFLGINLAYAPFSVGLIEENQQIAEISMQGNYKFSEELIQEIERMLEQQNKEIRDIVAIGAAIGPGSYTGLRLAATYTKTIAQLLNIPLYGIDTLEAMAEAYKSFKGLYLSVLKINKDKYYSALFGSKKKCVKRMTENMVLNKEEVKKKMGGNEEIKVLIGNIGDNEFGEIQKNINVLFCELRGTILAKIACARYSQQQSGDYRLVNPVY
jgi:tRNA threonylcarbamoyl adenosine modification protein YeaZ